MSDNHSDFKISFILILFSGLIMSICLRRFLADSGTSSDSLNSNFPIVIFCYSSSRVGALKGILPVNKQNKRTPKLHMSTLKF